MACGPSHTPECLLESLQLPVFLLRQAGHLRHLRLEHPQLDALLLHQCHIPLQFHLLLFVKFPWSDRKAGEGVSARATGGLPGLQEPCGRSPSRNSQGALVVGRRSACILANSKMTHTVAFHQRGRCCQGPACVPVVFWGTPATFSCLLLRLFV